MRPLARVLVRRASYLLLTLAGPLLAAIRVRTPPADPPSRILLIRLDLLGDVLFSAAGAWVLRRRYPQAHIAMLTLPYTAPLAAMFPFVDEVISVDTNRIRRPAGLLSPATWREYVAVVRHLRRQRFDLAFALSGPMASLWACLSAARRTVGYAEEAYPLLLTDPLPGGRYRERMHEVEYVLRLVNALGTGDMPPHLPTPEPSIAAARRARVLLSAAGGEPDRPYVVVHAGSLNGSAKRWGMEHWRQFVRDIRDRAGVPVVLVGAAGDRPIAMAVAEGLPGVVDVVGRTSVEELVAILAGAALVVSGDSGPLHLAVAVGRPLVCMYGPTDPAVHGPWRPVAPVALHRVGLVCSPCYSMAAVADCPLGDPICMRLIAPRVVLESALQLLTQGEQAARIS